MVVSIFLFDSLIPPAGHNGISHKLFTDNAIGVFIADFMGGLSIGWWKKSHNVHHIVTNSPENDPDIQHLPFFAVSTKFFKNLYSSYHLRTLEFDAVARIFVPLQHYLFYVVMSFGRFNLYVQSYQHLFFSKDRVLFRGAEIAGICGFWTWYIWVLSHLPSVGMIAAYVFISHALTALLHVQITISHFGMSTEEVKNEEWARLALRTTMDVDCPTWLDWLHGGLQFQVIHHLFPRVPRHNLRKIIPLVKQYAEKHGMTYHTYTFTKSNKIVLSALKQVGDQVKFMFKVAEHHAATQIKTE